MKNLKTTVATVILTCLLPTYAAAANDTKTEVSKSPMQQELTWNSVSDPRCYTNRGEVYNNLGPSGEELAVLGAVVTSLIGTGLDLIGSELAESAKEKTYTTSAILNIPGSKPMPVACMTFKRAGHYEFTFAMKPTADKKYIEPILLDYHYARSISGSKSGKRGVVILMNFFTPDKSVNISQSINLGNIKLDKNLNNNVNFESPYIPNPVAAAKGSPITASITLTEVKDANRLLQLTSDVFEGSKASLKSEIGKTVGVDEPAGG